MSNNCLVTKLKSTVNLDGGEKLGMLTFRVKAAASITSDAQQRVAITNSGAFTVYAEGCKIGLSTSDLTHDSLDFNSPGGQVMFYVSNEDGYLYLTNKYNFSSINMAETTIIGVNLDEFKYVNIQGLLFLTSLTTGHIDILKGKTITRLTFNLGASVDGDISTLDSTVLKQFALLGSTGNISGVLTGVPSFANSMDVSFALSNENRKDIAVDTSFIGALKITPNITVNNYTEITGDIANIGKAKSATLLNFQMAETPSGTIESILETMGTAQGDAAARTSGSLVMWFGGTNLTFHNSKDTVGHYVTVEFGNSSITVKDRNTSTVLGEWDGTSWSYPG